MFYFSVKRYKINISICLYADLTDVHIDMQCAKEKELHWRVPLIACRYASKWYDSTKYRINFKKSNLQSIGSCLEHTCPEPWSRFKKRHKQKVNVLLTPLPYRYWELLSKPQKIGKKMFFATFFPWKVYFFSFKASILSCFTLVFSQLCSWWNSDLLWPPELVCRSKIDVFIILENMKKLSLESGYFGTTSKCWGSKYVRISSEIHLW